MMYASLTGPLLGLYFPLPGDDIAENKRLLNSSKLAKLWCSVYPEVEVNKAIKKFGGVKLDESFAMKLF